MTGQEKMALLKKMAVLLLSPFRRLILKRSKGKSFVIVELTGLFFSV